MVDLIVTRHEGAIEWLVDNLLRTPGYQRGRREQGGIRLVPNEDGVAQDLPTVFVRVITQDATRDQVRDQRVAGVLPMALAAVCREYHAIEFHGPAPRGAEYTPADMDAAGAVLRRYVVLTDEERATAASAFDTASMSGVEFSTRAPNGGWEAHKALRQRL